jgi:hypothetical protein
VTEERLDFSPLRDPPTLKRFALDDSLIRVVVGPVGSGKTSRCVKEIVRRAMRQRPWQGLRRSRYAVIRNTYSQLRDTTRKTFEQWVPSWMGQWHEQSFTFHMRFDDVDCEILFRALDRPEDVRKLLSLELTGAYLNELREIPERIVDVLETRIGRYPSRAQGGPTWRGIWGDTNPWHGGHWGAKRFARGLPGHVLYRQPSGRAPNAENLENLEEGYYARLCVGKSSEYIKVYVDGEDADSDVGSVFGAWLAALRKRGGVCAFDHPTDEVFTAWDLGLADSTGIWFWRVNRHGLPDIIDHYENAGQGLSHYFGVVDGKGYKYAKHWLPFDAVAKTLATQQSVFDQCLAHWGAENVALVPTNKLSVEDGIEAGRWLLEQAGVQFHERCDVPGRFEHSGLEALQEYRYEWDEEDQCFSRNPIHNWASHTASAFRYLALVVKFSEEMTRRPTPDKPRPHNPGLSDFSLDEAWESFDRERQA